MASSKTAAQKAAEDAARKKAAHQAAQNAAKVPAGPAKGTPTPLPAGSASGPLPGAVPAPTGPAAPARVDPFFTADDLDAINAFDTDLKTKLQGIDTGLQNAETDTTYQKSQNDDSAKKGTSGATEDAAARGIFQSSVKDATLYDIEAQRSLSSKFLDDKLTTARLDAGANKQILGDAKTKFDENMAARKVANAQGVNDANNSAWAAAQSAWAAAHPQATAVGPAPPGVKAPTKGTPTPLPLGSASGPVPGSSHSTPANQSGTQTGSTKTKTKTTKVVYGNTP